MGKHGNIYALEKDDKEGAYGNPPSFFGADDKPRVAIYPPASVLVNLADAYENYLEEYYL